MRRALPQAVALGVAALVLAGCSDDSGGIAPDGGAGGGDTSSGDVVEVPGVSVTGDAAALSPDGTRIAVPCDGELCVWSTAEGTLGERWDGGGVVAWSTGGLVATDRVTGGTVAVVLLDDATGDEVATAEAYDAEVVQDGPGAGMRDLEFSPDGETLAGAGADGVVRLWSVDDPTDVTELDPEGDAPVALAFSSDGSELAVASSDAPVTIVEVGSGDTLGELDAPPQGHVAWAPDDATVATSSFALDEQAAVTIWDGETYEEQASSAVAGDHLTWLGPDSLVASVKDEADLRVWDWRTDDERSLTGATDVPRAVLVAPDESRVYAVSPRDGVLAWPASGGEVTAFEQPDG
jgi:WD40 repeat protein